MQSSINKVLFGTAFFFGSCLIAVIGYTIAGWSLLESIYMVTITIFGVGYGEVNPINDPRLQLFTIVVIIFGCTSSLFVMGGFVQMIAEGELNRFLGARRMTRGIERLNNHVIVCGFGRVGRILAEQLRAAGEQFVLVDINQERLQAEETDGSFVIVGDATEESVLEAAGIHRARALAVVLPNDAANVFITLTARGLREELEVIARAQSPPTERKLYRAGATRVVLPAALGAHQIAGLLTTPSEQHLFRSGHQKTQLVNELAEIGLKLTELPIPAGSPFVDRALGDLTLGDAFQFVIVAVRSPHGELTKDPGRSHVLKAGDVVVLLVHRDAEVQLRAAAAPREVLYRGARGPSG